MMRRSKYSCAHRESGWVRAGPRCSLPNGPRRAQSKGDDLSILRRVGIRQLPGICWYLAECTGKP